MRGFSRDKRTEKAPIDRCNRLACETLGGAPALDFLSLLHHLRSVGLKRSRPASQGISPKHCTLPVSRAKGLWQVTFSPQVQIRWRHGRSPCLHELFSVGARSTSAPALTPYAQ